MLLVSYFDFHYCLVYYINMDCTSLPKSRIKGVPRRFWCSSKIAVLILVLLVLLTLAFLYKDLLTSQISKISNKKGDRTEDTGVSSEESLQKSPFGEITAPVPPVLIKEQVSYDDRVGLPRNEDGNIDVYYVNIRSSGDVYSEIIYLDNGTLVNLFILRGSLENDQEVDVLIGISDSGFFNSASSNWWLGNMLYRRNIEEGRNERQDISEVTLSESYLESQFYDGSLWKYSLYFDDRISVPDEYRDIVDIIYRDESISSIIGNLELLGSTNFILLPF